MEAILDHYHAKLAEQDMSEAEVIGEPNANRVILLDRSSYYYIGVLIIYASSYYCVLD
jgi:hypothetical protein